MEVEAGSGFAAAQCGKALPYRGSMFVFEAAPPIHDEAQPQEKKGNFSVRRSLTALESGKAALALTSN